MNSEGSYIGGCLDKIRFYIDEATADAKYTDDFLTRYVLMPSMVDVCARINLNQDNPVCVRHTITLVEGQQYYQLPPCIQEIWRFAVINEDGQITSDAYPRGEYNSFGPGWSIEGNLLSVRPTPTAADAAQACMIWYVPNADLFPLYGIAGIVGSDNLSFTIGAATLGQVDRRVNAYAGQMLRIIGSARTTWQERVVDTYTPSTGVCTVRQAFSPSIASATAVRYEILPTGYTSLWDAISLSAALRLGAARSVSQAKMGSLQLEYRNACKSIKDNLSNLQMRTGKSFLKNTSDNPERGANAWNSWAYLRN
jgi:hypothetical protein